MYQIIVSWLCNDMSIHGSAGIILCMGSANETQCTVISHWLSPYTEWSLLMGQRLVRPILIYPIFYNDKEEQVCQRHLNLAAYWLKTSACENCITGAGNLWDTIVFPTQRASKAEPKGPGPRLNIKTVLSTYGDFHVKDKTAVRTSYL